MKPRTRCGRKADIPGKSAGGFSAGSQIYLIPQSIIFVQYDITDERRKDDSDIVRYNHLTVGWKTVF
jgi:hypothetical protein